MRIWDIVPKNLCRNHLLGEHRELHAIWSIVVHNKKGYSCHPETLRWKGKLKALFWRHEALIQEMKRRGYCHRSPLEFRYAVGSGVQKKFIDSVSRQHQILKAKQCGCKV